MNGGAALMRLAGAAGTAWGGVLLARGDDVWRRLEGRSPDPVEELAIRALGVRHLVQGAVQVLAPRATRRVAVGVDAVHAATMLGLALASPSRRTVATTTGAVALVGAAVGVAAGPR
ncbi:hypothetical protein KMZ32_17225 [Phycicoccus sp. MAQZ13P-2]|uniref:hypothetical protein n=1 Tax=Phycicoccus mangrovi TaxID=2840470 RepID=UPI001C0045FD|nr:hypothetical protein [Phycicoccus mangrovi]MBT9257511.1 hypothetical protein [Phycicoccus mangrovi]MBT9275820.1 hypothetical protein [Phycicoccus mangrovi]